MLHMVSTTRAVLIVISTLWFMAGCKPVADTTDTPLPTQSHDSDESSTDAPPPTVDLSGDPLPEVALPPDEPTGTEPAYTGPTDIEPADADSTEAGSETTGSENVTGLDETVSLAGDETEAAGDDSASNEQVRDEGASADAAGDVATLTIGSVAPPLQIGQWIKGDAIEEFTAGQVYVVEFWATWCVPCRTSMPHISQLQQDHQDTVTFIGVTPEDEETVHTFMAELQDEETGKTWNEVIQYNIALDRDSATNDAYMRAAEQTGIPTAFIIGKDGLIEWMGHPMSIDQPIADVLSDQWDREAALAKLEADRAMEVAQREVSVAARRAKESGDWTEVLQMVEKLVLKNPESSEMKIVQFNVLLVAEEYEDLNRLADELSAQVWDDANYLNRIAWQMVTRVPKDKQDLVVALKIALRASELADRNASVLETVARVYHEMGERDAAIQWQQRAVDAAPDQKVLRDALEKYEAENKEPL